MHLDHRPVTRVFGIGICGICVGTLGGCVHPLAEQVRDYMAQDAEYLSLPRGPERVDVLYTFASELGGSEDKALEILGSLAVAEGVQLRHPFNTGLTVDGPLACNDKTGHFFAHAMWTRQDERRLIPMAAVSGFVWEVCGLVKSWFGTGKGFDLEDIWANKLGREFARRLRRQSEAGDEEPLRPSDVISEARRFRPEGVAPDAPAECDPPPRDGTLDGP